MREQDLIAFGNKLKKFREEQKLDLKSIAERTKINIGYLKNLEEGNFNFLPELYVRSFLKLYLQQLGGNWVDWLDEYDDIRARKKASEPVVVAETAAPEPAKRWSLRNQITAILDRLKPYLRQMRTVWIGLIALVIFVAVIAFIKTQSDEPVVRAQPEIVSVLPDTAISDTNQIAADSSQIVPAPKFLSLELKALEKTWLQIVVDDSLAKELTFESGANQRWQARERFKLRIGNAAGVRLYLNGQDLGKLGHAGEVVKFDLTEQGIQKSTL
ncbi:MAG: DUF4115 domain-containing protein [candidate division KSB1 bacterium]|nr:DUF4115 domain-containing protein [candidate division KSB1 bacterium]MDZ7335080.1 DUF4115 domain-containing protein [candidate division KSB1 bacterium]MDZ7356251.1 DUF4115 domain-containing protein [candidate division KSB1 bacterium]MDZ7375071.1 DUF4115 domain-containing protein [candidate division KSB1 bacterium]MDZ7400056.1 DUF4115 domain-containing protein [candidate division KSB1 bacterium]